MKEIQNSIAKDIQFSSGKLKHSDRNIKGSKEGLNQPSGRSDFDQELLQANLVSQQLMAPRMQSLASSLDSAGSQASGVETSAAVDSQELKQVGISGVDHGASQLEVQGRQSHPSSPALLNSFDGLAIGIPMTPSNLAESGGFGNLESNPRDLINLPESGLKLGGQLPQQAISELKSKPLTFSPTTERMGAGPVSFEQESQSLSKPRYMSIEAGGLITSGQGDDPNEPNKTGSFGSVEPAHRIQVESADIVALEKGSSRPEQVGGERIRWVSGDDFMNVRHSVSNGARDDQGFNSLESPELLNSELDSNRLLRQPGAHLGKILPKEKGRLGSGKSSFVDESVQMARPSLNQNAGAILSPASWVPQKQPLPEVLLRERKRGEELMEVDSLKSSSDPNETAQSLAFSGDMSGMMGLPSGVSDGPSSKMEVVSQVVTSPGRSGHLSNEGLSQIGAGITRLGSHGGGEMRVRLRPDHLGEINIRIFTEGNRVGLKIQASDDRAKRILEDSMSSLKSNLSSQNLNLNTVEVSVANTTPLPDMGTFQSSAGLLDDSGQGRGQYQSQSERFDEGLRLPRQNSMGSNSGMKSWIGQANRAQVFQGDGRLDVVV